MELLLLLEHFLFINVCNFLYFRIFFLFISVRLLSDQFKFNQKSVFSLSLILFDFATGFVLFSALFRSERGLGEKQMK